MKRILLVPLFFFVLVINGFAATSSSSTDINNQATTHTTGTEPTTVQERKKKEDRAEENPYAIVFYKPTYILPFYYTGSPANGVYEGNTPNGESLKHSELKYQISFKVPIWKNILGAPSSLYLAYTQLSYWQAYNHYAFFRETDYEPELFLSNELNRHLFWDWHLDFLNVGVVHQSNGFGNTLERSWNRVYIAAVLANENWMITFRPWIVFHDSTYMRQNPHLAYWEGYEEFIIAFKFWENQVISWQSHNFIESGGRRSGNTFAWTFPLTKYIKGNIQFFTGYGQSLIEYNHRTNSFGIGIALSNWV